VSAERKRGRRRIGCKGEKAEGGGLVETSAASPLLLSYSESKDLAAEPPLVFAGSGSAGRADFEVEEEGGPVQRSM
jgi:hypothetical protein